MEQESIELTSIKYETSTNIISDRDFREGYKEIDEMLRNYLKQGIIPRIGESLVTYFDFVVIITSICYCPDGRILVSCNCT